MKNKLYITLLPIIFLGCGGGGGSTPVPAPITPIVISTPVESTPINTYNWETEEYMANTGNNVRAFIIKNKVLKKLRHIQDYISVATII